MNDHIQVENPSKENIQTTGIQTRAGLAVQLGVKLRYITSCLYNDSFPRERYYTEFVIPKSNGSERTLHAVNGQLKGLQKKCLKWLTNPSTGWKPSEYAHGFVIGKSIITNASLHRHKKLVIKMDIKDFFPSITFARVEGMFMQWPFEFGKEAAYTLAQICCLPLENNGPIPQGAVTSPYISNMLCRQLDSNLGMLAKKRRIHYSRYADDLTFSTSEQINPKKFINAVEEIVEENKFVVNQEKTRIMWYFQRQMVTGIIVNNRRLNVNRKYIRNTRAMLHNWEKQGLDAQLKSRKPKINDSESRPFHDNHIREEMDIQDQRIRFLKHLEGRIQFIGSVVNCDNSGQWKRSPSPDKDDPYTTLYNKYWRLRDIEDDIYFVKPNINILFRDEARQAREVMKMAEDELNEFIESKKRKDSRYFTETFDPELEKKRKRVFELTRFPNFSKDKVFQYLSDLKDTKKVLGALTHNHNIEISKFDPFRKEFYKDKYFMPYEIRQRFENILRPLEGRRTEVNEEDSDFDISENVKFPKEMTEFKESIRFEASGEATDLYKLLRKKIIRAKKNINKENCSFINLDKSLKMARFYTDVLSFSYAIENILKSMLIHSKAPTIHIKSVASEIISQNIKRNSQSILIFDSFDDAIPHLKATPNRDMLLNGKLKTAVRLLNGLCDWHITAHFENDGWKSINVFNSEDIREPIPQNIHGGFTHELKFRIK